MVVPTVWSVQMARGASGIVALGHNLRLTFTGSCGSHIVRTTISCSCRYGKSALGGYNMAVCLSFMARLRSWNCIGFTLIKFLRRRTDYRHSEWKPGGEQLRGIHRSLLEALKMAHCTPYSYTHAADLIGAERIQWPHQVSNSKGNLVPGSQKCFVTVSL